MDTLRSRNLRPHRNVPHRQKTLVRMGHRTHPLNPVVHILHHLPQTRLHRHVPNVVDHVHNKHDQMEKPKKPQNLIHKTTRLPYFQKNWKNVNHPHTKGAPEPISFVCLPYRIGVEIGRNGMGLRADTYSPVGT